MWPDAAGGRAGYGSPTVIAALVVAAVVLTVFVVVEARSREPMLDVRMMRSSGYTTTLVISAILGLLDLAWGALTRLFYG